jgi:hypothetical protein
MERRNGKTARIPLFDIHLAAFLLLNNESPELTKEGTRVIFEFPSTDVVHTLLRQYQTNPPVNVLDYAGALRRLRSMMLSMRG